MTYPPYPESEGPRPEYQGFHPGYGAPPPAYRVPPAPRKPSGRRQTVIIAALILVPVLVIGAVLATMLVFTSRDGADDLGAPVAGQLRNTYPEKPTAGWRLDGDDVFDRAEFVRPDPTASRYSGAGFLDFGEFLITKARLPRTDRPSELVAIDAANGEVLWSNSDAGFDPVCAEKLLGDLLVCLGKEAVFGPPGEGPPPMVSFLRTSDGRVDHALRVSEDASMVVVDGSDLYTVGYQYMARGGLDDLTAAWERSFPNDSVDDGCPGSGDSTYYGAHDGVAYFGSDVGVVLADARDGRRLVAGEPQSPEFFRDKGFAARECGSVVPGLDIKTVVYAGDGSVLHTVDSTSGAAAPWLVADTGDVPLIIEDTAYDFTSGDRLWTAEGDPVRIDRIVGDVALGYESRTDANGNETRGTLTGHDVSTGDLLWTSGFEESVSMSDGQRVILGESESLTSVNLATGERDWQLSGVSAYSAAPAGAGFAVAEADSITFYPPTGGPSVAPGRVAAQGDGAAGAGGLITKCGRTPELRPIEYRAENGALVVKMEIKARCPGGDIVSTNRLRVTVRDGDSIICSGIFDFSADPLVLGGDGAEPTVVDLTFGDGAVWRHPNTLGPKGGSGSGDPTGTTSAPASGDELVDCEDEGASSGPEEVDDGPHTPSGGQTTSTEGTGCADDDALNALRVQVDTDRPFVQSRLADRWIAQLSAKRPGLVAPEVDGRVVTWTPCEILRQHLRMRLQYPEVRLVWSDEWRTFDLRGWWVTFAGLTFAGPDEANSWCDQRAIPVDECFAKVVSNSRDSSGSTKYRR